MDPEQQQQQQNVNSGLARYRSAPSSYFTNLMSNSGGSFGEDDCDQFLNPRVSSPGSDRFFSRFMSSCAGEETNSTNLGGEIGENSLVNESVVQVQTHFVAPVSMKNEPDVLNAHQQRHQQQMGNQPQLDHKPPVVANSGLDNSYNIVSTIGMDGLPQMKMSGSGGSNSNLIRHSSSPAGLFANINVENGYAVMRGMGHFGVGGGANAEVPFSTGSRLKNQSDFPVGTPSSSGIMPHSVEIGGFPSTSWDDSTLISDNFLKEFAENQSNDGENQTLSVLTHHLSLPTSSAEMSAMEKLLQFQDSVPLKIRAKRGCATHPRSIAERVRRTRISERMRKLQELVPNMDKQTNTADMLDLAVDYIKDLQKQVKTLSDTRAKCTCSNKEKS